MAEQPVERGGARPGGPSPAVAACHPPVAPEISRVRSLVETALAELRPAAASLLRNARRLRREGAPGGAEGHALDALTHQVQSITGTVEGLISALGGDVGQPVLAPSSAHASSQAVRASDVPGRARLLVVDDDADARDALALVLGDDHEVLVAGDGREAVERAQAARPDLVLMDLYMPRMDGLAALEALRSDPLTTGVPVILISGRGDDLTRARSLDLGAVDFLQKPFSARELKARIERTLRLTRRESQLEQLARTDALTGLANLRAFRTRLDEEVSRALRYRTSLTCAMVDMDNLKPINDELGHAAGDLAIATVAEVIRRELRQTDFGARYGGDEFVLLLPHTTGEEACVLAERVVARLVQAEVAVGGRTLSLSASFGIASLSDEPLDDPGQTLVRHADAALYQAKRSGRGRVVAHTSPAGGDELTATPAGG